MTEANKKQNPRVFKEFYGERFYIHFDHPHKADFIWLGERWYSNFGGGVGLVKMREPQYFNTREEAEKAAREVAIPYAIDEKGWKDYIVGWE